MIKKLPAVLLAFIIFGCGSQNENDALKQENEDLQLQLDELKFGAAHLMSDARKFLNVKDYVNAKEKILLLLEKHRDEPESIEAQKILNKIEEQETRSNSIDLATTEIYINNYPEGKYSNKAKNKIEEFRRLNEGSEYESAIASNSSSAWKNFISNYPHRSDIADIQKRIIDCEVNEIMGSSKTGILPASTQTSYDYSTSSIISIMNDTQCELIVRYSGVDTEMIEIPAGSTRTVNLSSGNYRIAASACGANYAGTEDLHGKYSSKYYIVTSRY